MNVNLHIMKSLVLFIALLLLFQQMDFLKNLPCATEVQQRIC
jgi:hypothetical protein